VFTEAESIRDLLSTLSIIQHHVEMYSPRKIIKFEVEKVEQLPAHATTLIEVLLAAGISFTG